jgi:hypothetical protein
VTVGAAEPLPCRLTTQERGNLLKMRTSFGASRRVVLGHIQRRRFLNPWEFVHNASEHHLDLESPQRRPRPTIDSTGSDVK